MIRYTLILTSFLLFSCEKPPCGYSKKDLLADIEELADEIRDKDNLSRNQIKALDEKVEQLVEECYRKYEDDLTKKENKAFWGDVSKYYLSRHGLAAFEQLGRDLEDMGEDLGESLENWLEDGADRIEKWFDEFQEEDYEDIKIRLEGEFENFGDMIEALIEQSVDKAKEE